MNCPHGCGVTYEGEQAEVFRDRVASSGTVQWHAKVWMCPNCRKPAIELVEANLNLAALAARKPVEEGARLRSPEQRWIIWPRRRRSCPAHVPTELVTLYEEAALILDDSPRSAAALARRALQQVLIEHLDATGRDLEKQIDSVRAQLPVPIAQGLHGLRNIGNFAAHPIKSSSTGEIVEVEAGEAEWTLDILEALLTHVFVAPTQLQERLAGLNKKLEDAGKPTIDPTTGEVQRNG